MVADRPLPWWRRLFRRERREQARAAGERPRSMQPGGRGGTGVRGLLASLFRLRSLVQVGLGLVVALGVFGYVGIPSFRGYVDGALSGGVPGIVNRLSSIISPAYTVERPVSATASSELSGHPATKMFDTYSNTDWQGTGASPTITVTFKEPFRLGAVDLFIGNADAFVDMRRPARLALDFSNGSSTTIDLQDVHDRQNFSLDAPNVQTVTITVLTANGPQDAPVSISEIVFYRKG